MKLSIIIPCYNCKETIGRLLKSILENRLEKDDYEVIIVDDRSTDGFLKVVDEYRDLMNIKVTKTERDVHCPGNTRQGGLHLIEGEWFCFADNDDVFEVDGIRKFFLYIENLCEEPEETFTVCTDFREYNYEKDEFIREFRGEDTDTWLHGKFFRTDKVLKEYQCHFKPDMISHEDVFFNSWNLIHLIDQGFNYTYVPMFTYRWCFREDSLSRKYDMGYMYIERYMDDFLHGTSEPRLYMYNRAENEETQLWILDQLMMTLLHAYFYYQASVWRLGGAFTLDNSYVAIRKFKRAIMEETGLSENGMINYALKDAERYAYVREHCVEGTYEFVETQSFREFILNL